VPQTHGVGRYFWHKIRLRPDAPRHHTFDTMEYEEPFRWSSPSHVIRLFGSRGIVVGRWRKSHWSEEEQLFIATQGRVEAHDVVGEGGVTIEDHREQVYARRKPEEDARLAAWTVR
jgi:hypothetical protein